MRIWIAVASALTIAYFAMPDSPESKLVLYNGTGLLAVLAVLYGVHRNRPAVRAPWMWFAGGLGSFLLADICYYALELVSEDGPPFPSIADFFYLAMYPMVIVGLTKLLRSVSVDSDNSTFIDAAVVGMAMFGMVWILFVDDVVVGIANMEKAALLTQMAYPVMDVALLTVAARLLVKVHLRHPPFALILLAVSSLAVADVAYGIYNTQGNFQTGTFIDAFWLGFYILFAAAALHPTMAISEAPVQTTKGRLTGRQFAVMFVATMSVRVVDLFWGDEHDRIVIICTSAVLFILILSRVLILTRQLEKNRDEMLHEATHDALTGLSNRSLFADRTATALRDNADHSVAVLFIDLDDFKTINDSLGHQAGDRLLVEFARRLEASVREGDTVARLGGDEFAVLLESAVDRNDIISTSRRVLDSCAKPINVGARSVHVSCSIGISEGISQETEVNTLLRDADVAMYLSKRRGKGRFAFFETEMHEEAIERLDLKADLQGALAANQFVLHYQPIFDFETGRVVLTEALIRWRHPDRGMIPPDRFIPLAEENGQIVEIGAWVLREACSQAAKWRLIEGCEDIGITVNLSMRQLHDQSLLHTLTSALRESGLPASHLVLEITESMLAVDADRTTGILEQLKTTGIKLAIDDFGTGYSSLSYLRSFPVDSIKIDRSFINELHSSPTAPALIEAIVNLARALGAYTVAEGIELSEHATALRRLGCDRAQGFYYCRPMMPAALGALLREHAQGEVEPLAAWRRSSESVKRHRYDTDLREGILEIAKVADEITALNTELGVPLMTRWRWLRHWSEAFSDWTPHMIGVRRSDNGQLVACALLALRERAEGTAVVAMGNSSSLCTRLHATDHEAASALADAISGFLGGIRGTWSLDLEQLHDDDPTMLQLADSLEHAQVLPELRIPRLLFATDHRIDMVLSKSKRKQLRRAHRAIDADGRVLTIGFDRGRAISSDLMDEVEAVHVSRDREARRDSDLDRPAERAFWRTVVGGGDDDWEVEIGSLRIDGQLAAYVVALLDDDVYRVYDGRMNGDFAAYSPGRLIEAAALERAMKDPRFRLLDWMSGVAAEKLLAANATEGRARLVATSGSRHIRSRRDRRPELVEA